MNNNSTKIENIQEGTYQVLEELQRKIFNKLSPDDKRKQMQGLELSTQGQDILREEKAVKINSNSISILGARLAGLNSMELKDRVIDFLNKGPIEYKYLINDVSQGNLQDIKNLVNNLDGKFKQKYLETLSSFATEIQTLTNQIGAKLDALNEEFENNDINKRFVLSKTVSNGQYNYNYDEISQIVMNHIDSNVENVMNVYLEIQDSIVRNKGVEFKKNQDKDIFDVNNKQYKEDISNIIKIMEDIHSYEDKAIYSIISGKGNADELQEQAKNLHNELKNAVLDLPEVVRTEFTKQWEIVRGSVALEKVLNEFVDENSNNLDTTQSKEKGIKKNIDDGLDF